ncbi:basic proline-rich protein-like [Panthera leo]|uniref:basic proline-rich protein-like n=1 Tax=Panthera leo TaxID=9689 RepID=UPI001C6A5951|nr:basic proline-rich protein-like [Panthera leo]
MGLTDWKLASRSFRGVPRRTQRDYCTQGVSDRPGLASPPPAPVRDSGREGTRASRSPYAPRRKPDRLGHPSRPQAQAPPGKRSGRAGVVRGRARPPRHTRPRRPPLPARAHLARPPRSRGPAAGLAAPAQVRVGAPPRCAGSRDKGSRSRPPPSGLAVRSVRQPLPVAARPPRGLIHAPAPAPPAAPAAGLPGQHLGAGRPHPRRARIPPPAAAAARAPPDPGPRRAPRPRAPGRPAPRGPPPPGPIRPPQLRVPTPDP